MGTYGSHSNHQASFFQKNQGIPKELAHRWSTSFPVFTISAYSAVISKCHVCHSRIHSPSISDSRFCTFMNRPLRTCIALITWSFLSTAGVAERSTLPVEGLRQNPPKVHVLTGAKIVISPDQTLDKGTVVIRDGMIERVGPDVLPPADARIWDMSGRTIYPALIEAYSEIKTNTPNATRSKTSYWNTSVQPEWSATQHYEVNGELNKKLRSQGIAARLIAPSEGVIKGRSALVTTADTRMPDAVIQANVALHLRLTVKRQSHGKQEYPSSPMGAVALARQAMHDSLWYRQAQATYQSNRLPPPEHNDSLEVLKEYFNGQQLVIIDAPDEQYFLRADRFAHEFSLRAVMRSSGHEYRQLAAVSDSARTVIVPVRTVKAPDVSSPETAIDVTLEDLMHWDLAPENPGRLASQGVPIALTGHGLKDPANFLDKVRTAVHRGLSPNDALRAMTTLPAELFGIGNRLGKLETGYLANLLVTDGDLFADKTRVLQTWIEGQAYNVNTPIVDPRRVWKVVLAPPGAETTTLWLKISGDRQKLQGSFHNHPVRANQFESVKDTDQNKDDLHAVNKQNGEAQDRVQKDDHSTRLEGLQQHDALLTATFNGKTFGIDGVARLSTLTLERPNQSPALEGEVTWPDGQKTRLTGEPSVNVDLPPPANQANNTQPVDTTVQEGTQEPVTDPSKDLVATNHQPEHLKKDAVASFPVNFPLGACGRHQPPEQPKFILFQGATVWTCGKLGTLNETSVLVEKGTIKAVGKNLVVPPDTMIVDTHGLHLTPGIIDCHSHMATDGGINEASQAITAEVRIGDFIDARDIAIYRQLAGGVTTANILHGSANPIGGQNQVIKLRWGMLPEELKFHEAPPGIKFALGENVKQSNWGDDFTTRYPQTRMGVEQIIRDALHAALDYRHRWQRWQQHATGLPPRKDLELEALAEIIEGKRWIHCHSYRQDEILALLRTLEDFGIRIGTLQHILEGYKVADAMQKHGAMGSSFSDWWAYKFEVYDAIPYNGALMHQMGINVSFNSDSRELARHLNQEAAKAIKYGGVPANEAIKFVTLNPAQQLRIEKYVGSIDPGKQADLAIWNGPPLSNFSRCEQTWIEGRKYFDRQSDQQMRRKHEQMRMELIQKILQTGAEMRKIDEPEDLDAPSRWPREDTFCHPHELDHAS